MLKNTTFIKKLFLVLFCLFIGFAQPCSVMALTEREENLYSQNKILFYDPYDNPLFCEDLTKDDDGDTDTGESIGWDGHCSNVNAYDSQISKYYDSIKKIADQNGLPWEGIVAQLIGESSFMSREVCPFNPLGLKGSPSCDGKHRTFSSYDEAFSYYVNSIKPVREAMGKFRNDPYGYINFLINGVPGYKYATDPEYVNKISGFACGVQKWAFTNGKPISGSEGGSGSGGSGSGGSGSTASGTPYCSTYNDDDNDDKEYTEDDKIRLGSLSELVKLWAWPDYKGNYTTRMPEYAKYIDQVASYKGSCNGVDCGAFVANIIKASGWDTRYPQGPTSTQSSWLAKNWQKVSSSSLKLGDVGIKPGHVILYVGNIPGFNSKTASASQCDRAPMAGSSGENLNNYTWYRKK